MSFFTAKEAAATSNNRAEINLEIHRIEDAVMTAATAGNREATIGPASTPPIVAGFSVSATHYNAFADPLNNQTDAHKVARNQMEEVMGHFRKLNYTIRRTQHQSTESFNWIVKW